MAIVRLIGETATLGAFTFNDGSGRVNDDDPISLGVERLIGGNSDVDVHLSGLGITVRLTKTQARQLAALLTEATDI